MSLYRPLIQAKIMKNKLVLSLGSNLGNRYTYLLQAIVSIDTLFDTKSTVAPFYETPPWGDVHQSRFINTAVSLYTEIPAANCLTLLQYIEDSIGRTKTRKWGPRCIDIDIIFYGDDSLELEDLNIPHLKMHERAFVLKPITDLSPNFIHPTLNKKMNQLLSEIEDDTILFTL
jgi:2-amino-4-hydroxy-6-hydroxymethyldihydropteridine diphosphokinase